MILIRACVFPCTYIPQPEITELELTGVAVTLPIVGPILAGTVIVKLYVALPIYAPLLLYVSKVAVAKPDVEDGIALSHVIGIVKDAERSPAAIDCVFE